MEKASIENVSDTSIWVAYYRAKESERPDALFKDDLAKELIGERGRRIAEQMDQLSVYTEYNVITRTVIIDDFLRDCLKDIDTVVNLGAGLDTRPYRLPWPKDLRWIEVDYPHILALKNEKLAGHTPNCRLERKELDLSDDHKRRGFLSGLDGRGILVLTEGVIPYLSEEQVRALGTDLLANPKIKYWIADYISPQIYKYLKSPARMEKMKNAPFRFFPADWIGFFENLGWKPKKIQYNGETGRRLGRPMPLPFLGRVFALFFPVRPSGYILFERS
jgi:methyltransferase (TIGR00027 family)